MTLDQQYESILDSAITAGPIASEVVQQAEEELHVRFPVSYRKFLECHGAALCPGFEIAGLFRVDNDDPPMWQSIVAATKQTRRVLGDALPQCLLPISSDGVSLVYYLDTSAEMESPVVAYGPGVDCIKVSDSFEEFVVKAAADQLLE